MAPQPAPPADKRTREVLEHALAIEAANVAWNNATTAKQADNAEARLAEAEQAADAEGMLAAAQAARLAAATTE